METTSGLANDKHLSAVKSWVRRGRTVTALAQGSSLAETPRTISSRSQSVKYVLVAATIGAVLLAHVFRRTHGFHLLCDSAGYYSLGRVMAQTGLFHFSDYNAVSAGIAILFRMRTYGYPLFLALCGLFSTNDVKTFQFTVFEAQLFLYLLTTYYSSRTIGAALRAPWLACPLYLCTALNPWLLLHSCELLTDLLSAALIYLNFALLLRSCLGPHDEWESANGSYVGLSRTTLGLFFFSGFSVMLRPANLILAPATFALWTAAAALRRGRKSLFALPILFLAFTVPFLPQMVNNYAISGKLKPMAVHDLYHDSSVFGVRYIKYATGCDPHRPWILIHKNPFLDPSLSAADQSPEELRRKQPWAYLLTCATHGLCLFDQDTPFTYLTDPRPWYRWPSSLLSFAFLGVAMYGIALAVQRALRRGLWDRQTFASMAALLLSVSYAAIYLPSSIEARYGVPLFLLLVLFFITGLVRLRKLLAQGRYVPVGSFAAWFIAFLSLCAWLSAWLDGFSEIQHVG